MGNLLTRFRKRDVRIILLGLDSAGKTTILYRLKLDDTVKTVPTIGFNVENIRYKDLSLTAWDIGSRDKIRPLFRHYYKGADAVVFVIDSHDPERLDELNYDVIKPAVSAEELTNAVFLFLANKMDLPGAMSTDEISEKLGLRFLKHPWGILPVSAVKGEGLQAALDWLAVRLGSAQVKPRNFTTAQPKHKFLQQCRTASSLSSSSSTGTSKTDNSKPNAQAPGAPSKPVIFVNSKLYTEIMTTPTVSSGSVDNTSLSVSTPGSYYSAYVPRRTPGTVMNTFSSYSITQSMRDDVSRRKFSTISNSDIRKLSCTSLMDSPGSRKLSVGSMFDNPTHRKMSAVSLMDSPYRRKMSTSFVIDAPPYRKFSSASLMEAAYSRKLSAASLNDSRMPDAGYLRKMSIASIGNQRVPPSDRSERKLSMVSLGDSQDEPEKPKMSYLAAAPLTVATPPTTKRKSEDFTLAGFGKFSSIMADYIQSGRKDSDTSGDSLNMISPSDPVLPDEPSLGLQKPPVAPISPEYSRKTTEQMKEDHYNEMLSLLPESYTSMYYKDYFSNPMDKLNVEEESQIMLSALEDATRAAAKNSGHGTKNKRLVRQLLKCARQTSNESDSSASSTSYDGKRRTFYLFCTTSRKFHWSSRKDGRTSVVSPSHKRAYCSRAYSAIRCLFLRQNKGDVSQETKSIGSHNENVDDKKETRVSFDLQNHNIKVEVVDMTDDDAEEDACNQTTT